ncbi:MAG: 6-phosphofructokinase [bacterium]
MKNLGVLTSGGDAPGMNAVIRAVVRTAIYYGLKVTGIERGYEGLINNETRQMELHSVSGIINQGGTILKTVRSTEIRTRAGQDKAVKVLKKNNIDGLIVIGGDGSLQGALMLHKRSRIPVIGIPATIDNDVYGTDMTVGFDTAVNTAVEAIDKIRDTATSHERTFIIEVMGRERGFLALEVGLAAGAEIVLLPEVKYSLDNISKKLKQGSRRRKSSSIIVMAEGAGNPFTIGKQIEENVGGEIRVSVLGYIQRGGKPTACSRVLASKFGAAAVELFLKGAKAKIVAIQKNKITSLDLAVVCKHKKKLDLSSYKLEAILSI